MNRKVTLTVTVSIALLILGFILYSTDGEQPSLEEFLPYEAQDSRESSSSQASEATGESEEVPVDRPTDDSSAGERTTGGSSRESTAPVERDEAPTQAMNRQVSSGPALLPPEEDASSDEAMAQLSREQVQEGIAAFRPFVRRCYEESLEDFPEASGRIDLEFTIEASEGRGRVSMSEIGEGTTLYEERLQDCLLYQISEVDFDAPGGGGTIQVRYPFSFATK